LPVGLAVVGLFVLLVGGEGQTRRVHQTWQSKTGTGQVSQIIVGHCSCGLHAVDVSELGDSRVDANADGMQLQCRLPPLNVDSSTVMSYSHHGTCHKAVLFPAQFDYWVLSSSYKKFRYCTVWHTVEFLSTAAQLSKQAAQLLIVIK